MHEEWDDRRTRDRHNLREEIDYLHNKLRTLSSALESHSIGAKEVEQTVKNITKGFENTIDSHRADLNRIGNKQSDMERELVSVVSSRKVILSAMGAFTLLVAGIFYDYFSHRDMDNDRFKNTEQRIKKIELFIKDWE